MTRASVPAILVPSALIPGRNVLFNQRHPDFGIRTIRSYALRGLSR